MGYWSIKKLKKLRKILVINSIILGVAYLVSFMMFKLGASAFNSSFPIIASTPVIIVTNAILVYNWVKTHNMNIKS